MNLIRLTLITRARLTPALEDPRRRITLGEGVIRQRFGLAAGETRLTAIALKGARIFNFGPRTLKPEAGPLGPALDLAHPRLRIRRQGNDGDLQQIQLGEGHHPGVLVELPLLGDEADGQSADRFFLQQVKCFFGALDEIDKQLAFR